MLTHIRHHNLLLKWGCPIWCFCWRLLLKKTRMFVKQVQGSIISRNWLMISICREGSKCDDWQITEGFTISRFLRPPPVPPPVNQLWMSARHKSWIEMSISHRFGIFCVFKVWLGCSQHPLNIILILIWSRLQFKGYIYLNLSYISNLRALSCDPTPFQALSTLVNKVNK